MNLLSGIIGNTDRYWKAAKKYEEASKQFLDWNNLNKQATQYAENANASTRDTGYKQARTMGYGKNLALNKANELAAQNSGENYKAGMDQANNLAQQRMSAAAQNAQNQMAAQSNTYNEGVAKLKLGADAIGAATGLLGGTIKTINNIRKGAQ